MASSFQCLLVLFFSISVHFIQATATSNVYIVYLGLNQSHDPLLTSKHHNQLLSNVFECEEAAKQSIIYHYKHSFSGFSAKLNETQATKLSKMEGVVSVSKSRILKLHTTRSWDFMGLTLDDNSEKITPLQLAYGDDIVVGVLDSGVWPESESFQDDYCLGPIPSFWKGKCVKGEMFDPKRDCNRKLIGAQYYRRGFQEQLGPIDPATFDYNSPRDYVGHGTHTASTAVGSIVKNVSAFGFGQGTARGGAPRARLAVYKVCWNRGLQASCAEEDVLAGFDQALHDGVHVISVSIGGGPPLKPFYRSPIDIGAFHAMQRGVSVVFSAGNDGPEPSGVGNVAPWSISVAASTVDRTFPTKILVDNTISVVGQGLLTKKIKGKLAPSKTFFKGRCIPGNSRNVTAEGMIVLCFSSNASEIGYAQVAVLNIGASALIYALPITYQIVDTNLIPTLYIDYDQGTKLRQYINTAPKPVVISPSKTSIGKSPAPSVAYFSSRGPNTISADILKPDISAPGASIIAAWPTVTPPVPSRSDKRSVEWNFQSGTSMSCPHVSGVVALIKSAHPHWSPAAIRSAIITTANNRDNTQDRILAGGSMKVADPFDVGAGHINPLKAMDPGLVYDMQDSDYIAYLCEVGYTREEIKAMLFPGTHVSKSCVSSSKQGRGQVVDQSISNLNYPSITVSNLKSTVTIKRSVRNVGHRKTAFYFASFVSPHGVKVSIWPRILIFSCFMEERSYYVTLKPLKKSQGRYDFGEIVWSDGFHYVRSPLVVSVNTTIHDGDCGTTDPPPLSYTI